MITEYILRLDDEVLAKAIGQLKDIEKILEDPSLTMLRVALEAMYEFPKPPEVDGRARLGYLGARLLRDLMSPVFPAVNIGTVVSTALRTATELNDTELEKYVKERATKDSETPRQGSCSVFQCYECRQQLRLVREEPIGISALTRLRVYQCLFDRCKQYGKAVYIRTGEAKDGGGIIHERVPAMTAAAMIEQAKVSKNAPLSSPPAER